MARSEAEGREEGSLELISRHVERQMDLQWGHWDLVDGRLRLLLGFVGAVFVAVLAFISNEAGDLADATIWLVVAAILLLMMSAVIAGLAWLPRQVDMPPEPLHLRQKYADKPPREVLLAVVDTMVDAYNDNRRIIDEKLGAFRRAAAILVVAVFLMATGAIVELLDEHDGGAAVNLSQGTWSAPTPTQTADQTGPRP
jgi:hypothetical protein